MLKVTCLKNGPILISDDDLALVIAEGGKVEYLKSGPIALCRCGQSGKKPFCDGSHVNGFEAELVEFSPPEESERSPLKE